MAIEERLRNIPRSYDDFVEYVISCIKEDNKVEELVLHELDANSETNSSDILKAIYLYRGHRESIEIVDDEMKYNQVV